MNSVVYMQRSIPYQLTLQAAAFLLMAGVLLPSGIHAKAFVEFCLTNPAASKTMAEDHACCTGTTNRDLAHDCEWQAFCTCHIEPAPLSEQNWTNPTIDNPQHTAAVQSVTALPIELYLSPLAPGVSHLEGPPIWLLNRALLN